MFRIIKFGKRIFLKDRHVIISRAYSWSIINPTKCSLSCSENSKTAN